MELSIIKAIGTRSRKQLKAKQKRAKQENTSKARGYMLKKHITKYVLCMARTILKYPKIQSYARIKCWNMNRTNDAKKKRKLDQVTNKHKSMERR